MKFDYLISSSFSIAMHGALAVTLYGSVLSGPNINFSPGNAGTGNSAIDVSISTPAELGWMNARPSSESALLPVTPTKLLLPQPKAELSLSRERPRAEKKLTTVAPRGAASASPEAAESRPSEASALGLASPCAAAGCESRASLGRSGDAGASGAGILRAPKPPYPWEARRAGFEGSLVVNVDVGTDGSVRSAELAQSSGREDCDRSALETIRERWRFEPARLLGRPIDWREKVVVIFSLRQ